MAFFPRNFYQADNASFTPLFRLLDDFDSYSRQGQSCRQARAPQWQPKFDVRETTAAYELHGELPGMNKEDVHIEFTEPQTVTIRGKTVRSYTSSTPAAPVEDAQVTTPTTEGSEEQQRPRSPHQATVEDEFESISHESGIETPTETEKTETVVEAPQSTEKPADKAKYWLTERSIGEFARSFSFPTRVDQDTVSASFQDGILTIVVPKAKKHESRRITVF
ncbi:heat shock protein 30 [Dactylonectria estremocensis]|uniref:Heat shock protein 30 n=1 Tax=Dactylonectria estremocensis TaxID=1079267 RepID=A0A9P9EGY6_9HYPO|nr:heat shock protein 30 [Dactylonectria estremocensis]